MAATNGRKQQNTVVVDKLRSADQRWARRNSDQPAAEEYLEHLACSLENLPAPSNSDGEPTISDTEAARLREQVVAAENNAATRRAELDQARAEIDELRTQAETERATAEQRVTDLRAELGQHIDAQVRRAEGTERERDQLATQLTEARKAIPEKERDQAKLIRQLRADYDAAVADHQKAAGEIAEELAGVRTELAAMQTERDQLAERLGAATSHRCTWRWHGPDEPIKPCSCGRPVPRYELHEVG